MAIPNLLRPLKLISQFAQLTIRSEQHFAPLLDGPETNLPAAAPEEANPPEPTGERRFPAIGTFSTLWHYALLSVSAI
jgi:hypothetical protein